MLLHFLFLSRFRLTFCTLAGLLFFQASTYPRIYAFGQSTPSYTVSIIQSNAYAAGINNSDAIALNIGSAATYQFTPYMWTPSGGVQNLDMTGYTYGWATRISNTGYIAGIAWSATAGPDCIRWRQGEARQVLMGTAPSTESYDVNNAGQVLAQYVSSNLNVYLSVWTPGAGVVDLPSELSAAGWNADLNDNGVVAATDYAGYIFPYYQAAIWTSGGGISAIPGTYPIAGTNGPPVCYAENDNGQIVGSSCVPYGQTPCDAFFYDPVQGITNIGSGIAHAINAKGQVAGGPDSDVFLYGNSQEGFAWYWTPATGQIDLNTHISSTTDLVLDSAWGINDYGDIVADAHYANLGTGGPSLVVLLRPNLILASVTARPNPVVGSLPAVGKVALRYPLLMDTPVQLTNTNPNAVVPSSVIIPALATYMTFPITTTAVASSVSGTLTATTTNSIGKVLTKQTILTVRPIGVKSIKLSPTSVTGGNNVAGTVILEAPAAPGSITVTFSSSNPAVVPAPASITISAGSQTGTLTVHTNPVGSNTSVTVSATANGITKSTKLTVTP